MVWGGISGYYKTDLIVVNGNLPVVHYRDEILAQHIQPFMRAHQEVEIFQHNNARPYTARVCTAFCKNAGIEVIDWPAESPNLSLIENLWDFLGDRLKNIVSKTTQLK